MLDAEARLLDAATRETEAPTIAAWLAKAVTSRPIHRTDGRTVTLAPDQATAVERIAGSTRLLNVLVGPAGTGKTTTLAALKAAWEQGHGRGSVVGLAPSATAAELGHALGIACENAAKWLYEATGPGAQRRTEVLARLHTERTGATGMDQRARLRTIDTAITTLTAQGERFRLRPGQLLIVDEASLAGTFALDALTVQAAEAGAKVLLVGDHKQLSAVDAGGAFHLLAERGRPATLASLWRFTHPWGGRRDATPAHRRHPGHRRLRRPRRSSTTSTPSCSSRGGTLAATVRRMAQANHGGDLTALLQSTLDQYGASITHRRPEEAISI